MGIAKKIKKGLESIIAGSTLMEAVEAINLIVRRVNEISKIQDDFRASFGACDIRTTTLEDAVYNQHDDFEEVEENECNVAKVAEIYRNTLIVFRKWAVEALDGGDDFDEMYVLKTINNCFERASRVIDAQVDEAMEITITKEDRERLISLLSNVAPIP